MKSGKLLLTLFVLIILLSSCNKKQPLADAYGNFEAIETIISAEANGNLLEFNVEEGSILEEGQKVGRIDTNQLYLKKLQLEVQKKLVRSKFKNISSQIAVLEQQKQNALKEKQRIENLLKNEAATGKQLDEINYSINVLEKQVQTFQTQTLSVKEEINTIDVQIKQIEDQINKSIIVNPKKGTVILKLVEQSEVVTYGKPLYKIADLDYVELRAYISGGQLSQVKIGQSVKVYADLDKDNNKEYEGTVTWISSKAEFTPKIIQTKEERVNLVYAIKVRVKNDGSIKIGMPGEVRF
ncbi:MAG: HlyD family secretion protein [Ignavibacteria bacterium]